MPGRLSLLSFHSVTWNQCCSLYSEISQSLTGSVLLVLRSPVANGRCVHRIPSSTSQVCLGAVQNFLLSSVKRKQQQQNSPVNWFRKITSLWPPIIFPDVWISLWAHLLLIKQSSYSLAYGFLITLVYYWNKRLPLNERLLMKYENRISDCSLNHFRVSEIGVWFGKCWGY